MRFLFLVLLALILGPVARGDIYNRNALPFGEKEAFLGNAGTGGVQSVTAVYYNPAALVDLREARLAVTGSTYFQASRSSDNISTAPGAKIPYRESTFQTVPGTLVSTFLRGEWVWAYFLLVPEALEVENRTQWTFGSVNAALLLNSKATDLWGGLSGAYKLNSEWSIGVTLFGINRRGSTHYSIIAEDTSKANTASNTYRSLSMSVYCLSATVGVLYRPSEWLDIGFRLQSPFLHIAGDGTGFVSTQVVDNGVLTTATQEEKSLNARYSLPPDMTLGFHLVLTDSLDGYLDLSFQSPWTYHPIDNSPNFPDRDSVKATLRYSLGMKYRMTQDWELLGGFYLIPSGAREDTAAASLSIATAKGATLGVQWVSERVRTGIGGFFAWSNAPVKQISGTAPPDDFSTRIFGALITVGYSL
jgi:long-subunit fatty acid transport protein